jgi:hypothetical protein
MRPAVQQRFRPHPQLGYPLGRDWCLSIGWRYSRWPFWAGVATGAAWASWLGYPPYGGYGSSEQIVYYPVEAAPAEVYESAAPEVAEVVEQGQNTEVADDSEWLSIGTYGLIPMGQQTLGFAFQLAVTKEGVIRGMLWDFANNTITELAGSIDRSTMRVAWQAKGSPEALFFESNVDQLTQEESLLNVYDPKTKALVSWQMIQIDESDLPPS